jgi:hypothetical protein
MSVRWQAALAYALVGAEFALPETSGPDTEALLAELKKVEWTSERIAAHAREAAAAEQPWPHSVPPELRHGCGPAQFHAALASARALLDLQTMERRAPSGRLRLNADEERLMREVPPHHGH